MINRRYRAGLYRHVSASNVKLFSSFSGSLMHFGITTFYLCCHPWFNCSVERCFGGCGFTIIYFWRVSPSDTRRKLSLVYCCCSCIFLNKLRILEGGNTIVLCSGISVGWMLPPFAAVVAKRYKTMLWWGELLLNMSTYPQRNSSG